MVPADIPAALAWRLISATEQVIRAVGVDSGVVHCEWIVPASGPPHLVECAGRMPGDMIIPMIHYTCGVDLPGLLLDTLRGIPVEPDPVPPQEYAVIRFLAAAAPGRVTSVSGLEAAEDHPDVLQAMIHVQPGELVGALRSSHDRVASVIAAAPVAAAPVAAAASAAAEAEAALAMIEVSTGQAEPRDNDPRLTELSQPLAVTLHS